jgi:hypothetical protein
MGPPWPGGGKQSSPGGCGVPGPAKLVPGPSPGHACGSACAAPAPTPKAPSPSSPAVAAPAASSLIFIVNPRLRLRPRGRSASLPTVMELRHWPSWSRPASYFTTPSRRDYPDGLNSHVEAESNSQLTASGGRPQRLTRSGDRQTTVSTPNARWSGDQRWRRLLTCLHVR